jgi:hypothetical protein
LRPKSDLTTPADDGLAELDAWGQNVLAPRRRSVSAEPLAVTESGNRRAANRSLLPDAGIDPVRLLASSLADSRPEIPKRSSPDNARIAKVANNDGGMIELSARADAGLPIQLHGAAAFQASSPATIIQLDVGVGLFQAVELASAPGEATPPADRQTDRAGSALHGVSEAAPAQPSVESVSMLGQAFKAVKAFLAANGD